MNRESPTSSPAVHGDALGFEDNEDEDLHEALPTASLSLNYIYLQASEERVVEFADANEQVPLPNASSHFNSDDPPQLPGGVHPATRGQEPLPSSASSNSESSWDLQRLEVPLNSSNWRQSAETPASSSSWQPVCNEAASWIPPNSYRIAKQPVSRPSEASSRSLEAFSSQAYNSVPYPTNAQAINETPRPSRLHNNMTSTPGSSGQQATYRTSQQQYQDNPSSESSSRYQNDQNKRTESSRYQSSSSGLQNLSSSVQLHLVPSSSQSSSSAAAIYPHQEAVSLQTNSSSTASLYNHTTGGPLQRSPTDLHHHNRESSLNSSSSVAIYPYHRVGREIPPQSSSSTTVYPTQHSSLDLQPSNSSSNSSVSVYTQQHPVQPRSLNSSSSCASATSADIIFLPNSRSSTTVGLFPERLRDNHPVPRNVTSSSSRRIDRSTLESGETLHLGDVSITRATSGNQRPVTARRSDPHAIAELSSHSGATVSAIAIEANSGSSRQNQDPLFLHHASNPSSSSTNPSPPNSNQAGASGSAIFRPSVTVSVVPSSVSKPCVSSAAACTSVSTEHSNAGGSNTSRSVAGTSRNRAVARPSSCGQPIIRPHADVDAGSSAAGQSFEVNVAEPIIEAVIAEPVLATSVSRSNVEARPNSSAFLNHRSSPSVSIVAGPSVSSAVVARPIVCEAVVAGPSAIAASLANEATAGSRSNAVVIELNDRSHNNQQPGSSHQRVAKRSINFPDSPHLFNAKRSRLLDDGIRPDSPSDHHPIIDHGPRANSRNDVIGNPARGIDLPDDDCDNEALVSGASDHEEDAHLEQRYMMDRPSSQSDYFQVADGNGPGSSRLNNTLRASIEVIPVEGPSGRRTVTAASRYQARVGSSDIPAPSPAGSSSEREWDASDLVSGSDMSSRVNVNSRRTLSESSEAEGTVTYNRELILPLEVPLQIVREHHVSPTGSEVSEAGRSHFGARGQHSGRQATPASPTGSDVSEAGPSHYAAGGRVSAGGHQHARQPTPASPTGSDVSEAGPSNNAVVTGRSQQGRQPTPASPTGSDASEAGPSSYGGRGVGGSVGGVLSRQPTPASPTGSDVSAAESTSQNRVTDHSNPNSPSGSEVDEPGPSQGFGVVGGGGSHHLAVGGHHLNHHGQAWYNQIQGHHQPNQHLNQNRHFSREAAPAPSRYSPEPFRYRSRARYSDQCAISSSTGPDSNPPSPEFNNRRNIDNEVNSRPRAAAVRRYLDDGGDGDNVVDSTVDSTSGNFIIPSPIYRGNEAEHEGDSDSDMNDSESIPGSEASSTTASIHEHNFFIPPGFDDNEGISTSGQVDDGSFRLVPNDVGRGETVEEASAVQSNNRQAEAEHVPDVQASISSDESIGQLSDQGEQDQTQKPFKRPMNRKGRLLQNYHDGEEGGEPAPGPSGSGPSDYGEGPCSGSVEPGSSARSGPSVGSFLQGAVSLTLVSGDSYASAAAGSNTVAGEQALPADSPASSAAPASGSCVSLFTLGNSRGLGSSVLSNAASAGGSGSRIKDSFSGSAVVSSAGPSSSSSLAETGPSYEPIPTVRRPGFPSTASGASSLFNLSSNNGQGKRGGYNGQDIAGRESNNGQDANSKVSDFLSSSSYAESLGIGHAFSGLPSSLTDPWEQESNSHRKEDKTLTGPLAKRIKTKHMKEIALSSSVTLKPTNSEATNSDNEKKINSAVAGPSSQDNQQSPSKKASSSSVSIVTIEDDNAGINYDNTNNNSGASVPTLNIQDLDEVAEVAQDQPQIQPNVEDVQVIEQEANAGNEASRDNTFPGGSHQSYNLRLEHDSINLLETSKHSIDNLLGSKQNNINSLLETNPSAMNNLLSIKSSQLHHSKKATAHKPADYRELFDFDSSFDSKHGSADDMPLTITDAINEVDVNDDDGNTPSSLFSTAAQNSVQEKSADNLFKLSTVSVEPSEVNDNNEEIKEDSLQESHNSNVPEKLDTNSNNKLNFIEPPSVIEYPCKYCDRKFLHKTSLDTHIRLHKGGKKYVCDVCQKKFVKADSLRTHKRQHHGGEHAGSADQSRDQTTCHQCRLRFQSNMLLKIHQFSHNPDKEEQNWRVEDALAHQRNKSANLNSSQGVGDNPGFSGEDPFHKQMALSPSNNPQKKDDMRFECPGENCGEQFDVWLELVEHTIQHVHHNYNQEPESIKCGLCYKNFSNEERLKKHMRVHVKAENKPLKCDTCGKGFLTNSALAGHSKFHANNQFDCPICLRKFSTMFQLKDHVYEHKENGVFTCPYCQKIFAEYQPIRKHIRSYHIKKHLKCKVCKQTFSSVDDLVQHESTHKIQKGASETTQQTGIQILLTGKEDSSSSGESSSSGSGGLSSPGTCGLSLTGSVELKSSETGVMKSDSLLLKDERIIAIKSSEPRNANIANSNINAVNHDLNVVNPGLNSAANSGLNNAANSGLNSAANSGLNSAANSGLNNAANSGLNSAANSGLNSSANSGLNSAANSGLNSAANSVNWKEFSFKCSLCKLGFKRRGMLVNHLNRRHPGIELSEIPELNQPIVRQEKDFYCQYCPKIYKTSSKRKCHILKKHPGQPLPASIRNVDTDSAAYALATGQSRSSLPYSCSACHRQYVDKSKLLDHQRKDHGEQFQAFRELEIPVDDSCASTSKIQTSSVSQAYNLADSGQSFCNDQDDLLTINTAELKIEPASEQEESFHL